MFAKIFAMKINTLRVQYAVVEFADLNKFVAVETVRISFLLERTSKLNGHWFSSLETLGEGLDDLFVLRVRRYVQIIDRRNHPTFFDS